MYKDFTMSISGISVNSYPINYNGKEQDYQGVNPDVKDISHGKSDKHEDFFASCDIKEDVNISELEVLVNTNGIKLGKDTLEMEISSMLETLISFAIEKSELNRNPKENDESTVQNVKILSTGDLQIKTFKEALTNDIEILTGNSDCKIEKLEIPNESNENSGKITINDRPVMQRSKSLKTCITPTGNPHCPKLVR